MDTERFADIVYSFWFGFYSMQNLLQYVSTYFDLFGHFNNF